MRNRKEDRVTIYVQQDGADFYIYLTPACDTLPSTWRYTPGRVTDFNLPAAQRARTAFESQAKFAGYDVEWPNPFGEA